MLASTQGIVLRHIKFRETSIIATIYTEEFGMQSYIINGIRSPKSKRSLAHFQPLMLLDLVVYHKSSREIQRLSEWKSSVPLIKMYTDLRRSTIALFISEVLYKTIREQEPNREAFRFIFHSIELFDEMEEGVSNFHLQFLVKLARYIGFGTEHYISSVSEEKEILVRALADNPYGEKISLSGEQRRDMLEYIIRYYREHAEGFGELKSYGVLKEIFASG